MFEELPSPDGTGWAAPGVPVERRVPPCPELVALQAAVEALAGVDVAGLVGAEVLGHTRAVLGAAHRLRLLALAALGQVHERDLYELDGAGSAARWVSSHGLPVDRTELTVARRLAAFPVVAARVLSGGLSLPVAHCLQVALLRLRPHLDRRDGLIDGQGGEDVLRAVLVDGVRMLVAEARGGFPGEDDPVLARLLSELPAIAGSAGSQLDRVQAALVLLAEHVEPAQLSGCLGLLVDALLPEQLEQAGRRGHDRRHLRLVQDPGGAGWQLRGQLDLAAGERLYLLLHAEMGRDPDNPLDTQTAVGLRAQGLDPYDQELAPTLAPRSRAQRMHDALDRGLARYLAADLGGVHDKNPVQIVVTVPAQGLDGPAHRRQAAEGQAAEGQALDESALDGQAAPLPARAGSGTALPRHLVRRWVCGSALTRHVLDLRGRVVAVSHTERTLRAAERRALHTQTGGHCQGAGCTRSTTTPGTVLHPHHGDPWSLTGTTSLRDTVHLCDSCHHHLHDGGHTLRFKDGRRLGPDGWLE